MHVIAFIYSIIRRFA